VIAVLLEFSTWTQTRPWLATHPSALLKVATSPWFSEKLLEVVVIEAGVVSGGGEDL
jgi:hypothetical protein